MKEDIVSHELAVKLKELGFDCMTYTHYTQDDNNIRYTEDALNWNNGTALFSAPRLDQAQKWLREVKEIDVLVFNCACGYGWEISKAGNRQTRGTTIALFDDNGEDKDSGMWLSYESALSAGIDKALELLTNKS